MESDPNSTPGRELGQGYRYVGLGCTFAGGTVLFAAVGFAVDRWLGLPPAGTIVGTLAGAVLSFLNVYWKLRAETEQSKKR